MHKIRSHTHTHNGWLPRKDPDVDLWLLYTHMYICMVTHMHTHKHTQRMHKSKQAWWYLPQSETGRYAV